MTTSVVVGQQIPLTAEYTLGDNDTFIAQSWSIDGSTTGAAVGGWTPGSAPSPVSINEQSATFYWITAGTHNVSFTLQLVDENDITVSTSFNVAGPTSLTVSVCGGSGCPGGSSMVGSWAINSIQGSQFLQFGGTLSNVGVSMAASATAPPGGSTNNFVWVQTLSSLTKTYTTPSGTTTCNGSGVPGLDNTYPYRTFLPSPNQNDPTDNPGANITGLPSGATDITYNITAKMYLLWHPGFTNDIPVPLGYVPWTAFGHATLAGGVWNVQNDSTASASAFTTNASYPTWSSVQTTGPICPNAGSDEEEAPIRAALTNQRGPDGSFQSFYPSLLRYRRNHTSVSVGGRQIN